MNVNRWTDYLPDDVYIRLCNCHTIRSDLAALVNAKWLDAKQKGKDRKGYMKGDALVDVMELLDENGCAFDLTHEDWEILCN